MHRRIFKCIELDGIYSDVRAERFVVENNKITSVVGQVVMVGLQNERSSNSGSLGVRIWGGAINGPALFLAQYRRGTGWGAALCSSCRQRNRGV